MNFGVFQFTFITLMEPLNKKKMTLKQATNFVADRAYEKNMGILEYLMYLQQNLNTLSAEEKDAYYTVMSAGYDMFKPVYNEYQTYSEHSE